MSVCDRCKAEGVVPTHQYFKLGETASFFCDHCWKEINTIREAQNTCEKCDHAPTGQITSFKMNDRTHRLCQRHGDQLRTWLKNVKKNEPAENQIFSLPQSHGKWTNWLGYHGPRPPQHP